MGRLDSFYMNARRLRMTWRLGASESLAEAPLELMRWWRGFKELACSSYDLSKVL